MTAATLVSLVGQGVQPTFEKTDRACTINGTKTRARVNGEPVCQGCLRRAQRAAFMAAPLPMDRANPLHPEHVVAALGLTPFQREYMRQLASQPQGDPRGVLVTKGGRA